MLPYTMFMKKSYHLVPACYVSGTAFGTVLHNIAQQAYRLGIRFYNRYQMGKLRYRGASQVALVVKNLPANAEDKRDAGSIRGSGRSPGGWRGNPLQWRVPWTEEPGGMEFIGLIAQSDTTEAT